MSSGTKVLATGLLPGDTIIVTIAAVDGGKGGARLPISLTFKGDGTLVGGSWNAPRLAVEKINGTSQNAPAFPQAEFNAAVAAGNRERCDEITEAYSAAVDTFEENGGGNLGDAIAQAVFSYLRQHYNVRTEDHEGPVINADDVVVRPAYRATEGQETTFLMQLAPAWG